MICSATTRIADRQLTLLPVLPPFRQRTSARQQDSKAQPPHVEEGYAPPVVHVLTVKVRASAFRVKLLLSLH